MCNGIKKKKKKKCHNILGREQSESNKTLIQGFVFWQFREISRTFPPTWINDTTSHGWIAFSEASKLPPRKHNYTDGEI